ncbi:MAG TPA: fasciclin domain-containing protein [Gaiellaceae bacterium]
MKKLIPLGVIAALALSVAGAPATARPSEDKNIVQTAQAAGNFKTLTKLVTKAGLAGTLSQPGPYTVFAPTDAAFKKVPKATLKSLAKHKAKLRAVLLYHVVAGEVPSSEVVMLKSVKTENGKSVRIRTSNGSVYVNTARVTKPDVNASNGVIHVINRVLIPPAR